MLVTIFLFSTKSTIEAIEMHPLYGPSLRWGPVVIPLNDNSEKPSTQQNQGGGGGGNYSTGARYYSAKEIAEKEAAMKRAKERENKIRAQFVREESQGLQVRDKIIIADWQWVNPISGDGHGNCGTPEDSIARIEGFSTDGENALVSLFVSDSRGTRCDDGSVVVLSTEYLKTSTEKRKAALASTKKSGSDYKQAVASQWFKWHRKITVPKWQWVTALDYEYMPVEHSSCGIDFNRKVVVLAEIPEKNKAIVRYSTYGGGGTECDNGQILAIELDQLNKFTENANANIKVLNMRENMRAAVLNCESKIESLSGNKPGDKFQVVEWNWVSPLGGDTCGFEEGKKLRVLGFTDDLQSVGVLYENNDYGGGTPCQNGVHFISVLYLNAMIKIGQEENYQCSQYGNLGYTPNLIPEVKEEFENPAITAITQVVVYVGGILFKTIQGSMNGNLIRSSED